MLIDKKTPEDALDFLRREVEAEVARSRKEDTSQQNLYHSFTAVFMSMETFEKLWRAKNSRHLELPHRARRAGYHIKAALNCTKYMGYVVTDDSLPSGNVVIKRQKGQSHEGDD